MGVLSRAYILTSIALVSLGTVVAHRTIRKSLNFRPPLIADFFTDPLPILSSRDSFQTAHAFLRQLAYPDDSYFIRKDSYTDEITGISHIYVRQVLDGLEVADGNINLNIRDGQILSYGNSFFAGSTKHSLLSNPNWHQAVYCSEAAIGSNDPACGIDLDRLQAIASRHAFDAAKYYHDPRTAAFYLLQVVYPDPASLTLSVDSLEAESHECTDPLEGRISCKSWLVTSHSAGLRPIYARQVYVQTPGANGLTSLNLAWRLEVPLPENHYIAYVSVHDPSKIISLSDSIVDAPSPYGEGWQSTLQRRVFDQDQVTFASIDLVQARSHPEIVPHGYTPIPQVGTYRVWKWGTNDPQSGNRTLEVAPADRIASPLGWHSVPAGMDPLEVYPDLDEDVIVNFTTTVGNNVIAQEKWDASPEWKTHRRPDGGPNLTFDFSYAADPSEPGWEKVEPSQYVNLSITQVFYTANMYHDLLYLYGFDEASGNFQQYNFGKRGAEGDAIILDAQAGGEFNGAYFTNTVDGVKPFCRMHIWDLSTPFRDGGLDAGILIHELSHGLSSRLTGGPNNLDCLGKGRYSGGLGEGWSDFIATTVRSTSTYQDYPIGAWAMNNKSGQRGVMYSTNTAINPAVYGDVLKLDYNQLHAIGAVWAEILYVVSNKLIDKHGFADSLFPSSESDFYQFVTRDDGTLTKVPKHGNTLMLQLIVTGMKMQPCNPSFITARNAILAADKALTGGVNNCTLWNAFASRGLGTDAKEYRLPPPLDLNGHEVPFGCK
ncbi:unnamed protein product [Rhizoctonia solani]|uniref:Extracellular metalloproteinase n=1 Tax=Rhizoctonia solani TaxID=456999 RepID=A0A8H2XPI1_9AGAM|nr:unnamed protein product [Rhizoctonia solani]